MSLTSWTEGLTLGCSQYETGAVGSLTHTLTLQGYKYSVELDILADGYQLKLIDPYNSPELRVRTPDGDEEQVYKVCSSNSDAGEEALLISSRAV